MQKKWRIAILALVAVVVIGGVATYLFTIGPLGKPVLATVNGERIPVALFHEGMGVIDPAVRDLVREDPSKLVDILINRVLLLQQAKKEGISAPKGGTGSPSGKGEERETAIITAYLDKKVAALPPVPPGEIDRIYESYKDRMGGRSREEATVLIRQMLDQQRGEDVAVKTIDELRKKAKIEINAKELQKLSAVPSGMETQSEADFRKALTGGKPAIVDFGSNSCIPCRELRPVLQKLRKDYAGKLEVLIIDVRNYQKLAADYKIQFIPTVVFFDAAGKEVFRNQGFMSEEKFKEQLTKLGMIGSQR